jgi:hypothetical protein
MIVPRRVARDDHKCPGSNRAVRFLPRWNGNPPCGYGLQPVSAAACTSAPQPPFVFHRRQKLLPDPGKVLPQAAKRIAPFRCRATPGWPNP